MFDADVILFQNPWLAIKDTLNTYDVQYQREFYDKEKDSINSGQMMIRNTTNIHLLIDYIISKELITLHNLVHLYLIHLIHHYLIHNHHLHLLFFYLLQN